MASDGVKGAGDGEEPMEPEYMVGTIVDEEEDPSAEESPEEVKRRSDEERLEAANALRDWIAAEDPPNRAILERLEGDIRADRKLNEWGSFALDDLLRPPSVEPEQIVWYKVGYWVTLLRNVLLFLPVLITWTAIERAASAHSGRQDQTRSFLDIWSNDVESIPIFGSLTLARVALLDALVIGLLILLTVVAHLLDTKAGQTAIELDEASDLRFRTVMVTVGLFLHGFRQITPSALKGNLADAVNSLATATIAVKDASEGLERVANKAAGTLEEFAKLSAKEFTPAAERLEVLVTTLKKAGETHGEMDALVKMLQEKLAGEVSSLDSKLDDMTEKIVEALRDNAVLMEKGFVETMKIVDDMSERVKGSAAATYTVLENYAVRRRGPGDRAPGMED